MDPSLESKRCWFGKEVKDNGQLQEHKLSIAKDLVKELDLTITLEEGFLYDLHF